jgi:superfamily II DNA/RNA helicase
MPPRLLTHCTALYPALPQALVVAPSQELAMQIVRVAQALLPAEAKQQVQQCIGGANPYRQREALALFR